MAVNCRHFLTIAVIAVALGCSSANPPAKTGTSSLTVTASSAAVIADGVSTVTIHVDGSIKPPVRVATNRGGFANGSTSETFDATPFDATLYSCDARVQPACAGPAVVQVVDASLGTGAVQVVFTNPAGDTSGSGGSGTDGGTGTDGGSGSGGSSDGGTATAYVVSVIASSARIPADGRATAVITAGVTADGKPAAGRTVTFVQNGSGAKLSAASQVTDSNGLATIVLTSDANGGVATVTATDVASSALAKVDVTMPKVYQVKLAGQQYGIQGVRSSGYQETNQLTFQVLDPAGQTYPPGLAVSFTHPALWGSYLGTTSACASTDPANPGTQWVCTATGTTDTSGQVTVELHSGQIATLASITATAVAGGQSAAVTATIPFVGAKPTATNVAIDCTPKNVPGLTSTDCATSSYVGPGIICTATFSDRFNNVVAVPVSANFASEAGIVGPPVTTPQYDPKLASQSNLGVATTAITVAGGKLPKDVDPIAGEGWVQGYSGACGSKTYSNPRDGLVTVLVWTRGEEGNCDAGGPYVDMGEPFVDLNDDGVRQADEPYIDVNGNSQYDGPNGRCDSDAVIWAETRVLYTGNPAVAQGTSAGKTGELFSRFVAGNVDPASSSFSWLPDPSTPPSWSETVQGGTAAAFSAVVTDQNLNPVASTATYEVKTGATGVLKLVTTAPFNPVDSLGMSFTRQFCDSNGNCAAQCTSGKCTVKTSIGRFTYGNWSRYTVAGACTTNGTSDAIGATASLGAVSTALSPLPVACNVCDAQHTLCGSTCVDASTDASNCGRCGNVCAGTSTCTGGVCGGGGGLPSPYALAVSAASSSIPADGQASTVVTATVTYNGIPAADRTVTFAIASGPGTPASPATVATNASGIAAFTLKSDGTSGVATVAATSADAGTTKTVTVDMPQLGNISLASQQYKVLGVKNSRYQETSFITFQVTDSSGRFYPAGLNVTFTHTAIAGSDISSASAATTTAGGLRTTSATTDASGLVSVSLSSGTAAALATVTASTTAGGASQSSTAQAAFVGALPNGANIAIDCTPKNIPALVQNDCQYSYYIGPGNNVSCTATLGDIYGNAIGIPVLATFMSEAGTTGPAMQTPAYTFNGTPPTAQTGLGIATTFITVSDGPLPKDVGNDVLPGGADSLFTGEPFRKFTDACGTNRIHNPRDGLVTVIAMARGQQGFVDLNGNGIWDAGEPYIDQGEPFVDLNDNGVRDPDEPFVDANGNGVYDGPGSSGYQNDTVIWAATRILYTGAPDPGSVLFEPAAVAFAVTGTTTGAASTSYPLLIGDANLNPISRASGIDKYGVVWADAVASSDETIVAGSLVEPAPMTTQPLDNNLGLSFAQLFCSLDGKSNCSNRCTAMNSPCRVVPQVGFFPVSALTRVVVTGACTIGGGATVRATVTASGVPVTASVTGTCTP